MSGPGRDSEPEAKVLLIKRLYRAVVESVHKLDVIIGSKASYREVFKPENISLRNKLRELCVKLMFLHPVDYGRKAEELLWRKVYYEVIQVIKTNKKHIHSRSVLECAYRTHLIAGVGFYQHLLLYIQSHYQLELQDCIDWTHVTDPLIGRKKAVSASPKEMECAQMACHRCLVYLGDLARYQNELAGVEAENLAERFYHQALSVMPHVGMPFNQLGTLAGSKFYNVEATYYYLRCIQSESPFEGAYGNLKRLFDKAAKMYQQVKKQEMKKLSPSRQRSRDIKRLLVSFMYLQSLLQPKNSLMESEVTSLCQSVLEDFNLVLFYLPSSSPPLGEEDDEQQQQQHAADGCAALPDALVFKMAVTCLMAVHGLKRGGSKQYSASIAFTLALFSHLVNHVNIRLQAELEEAESPGPSVPDVADEPDDDERPLQNGSLERGDEEEENGGAKKKDDEDKPKQQKKKYTRLSRLRRRRKDRGGEDESDLSEGFESEDDDEDEEEDEARPALEECVRPSPAAPPDPRALRKEWGSGSEEEEEDGGTAFDAETDSDMNSQESRSDLEDMEEAEGRRRRDPPAREEEEGERTPPGANGDASISSNLQAMSSQLFQAKRCFRLAPTFSNMLPRPQDGARHPTAAAATIEPLTAAADNDRPPCNVDGSAPNGTNENETESDSEGSRRDAPSPPPPQSEKTLPEKLEILSRQGLIRVVKVFADWLGTNADIVLACAQSSQSLWNRLSVLLNLLPDGKKMLEAAGQSRGSADPELTRLLMGECEREQERERPARVQTLPLPEDVALRHLPALAAAHRRLDFARRAASLSPLQECVVRVCCIRSFGHFLTSLQCNVLHFNSEAGIFTSVSQSQPDNLMQQAKAQFRMAEEEARRNRLMRDMAQLRLQLEVSQLEGSLQHPKAQSAMSPYLVPDDAALCQHLGVIRHLVASGCFIIIIPRTVIDGLDRLKKENAGARDGIRFLESEFRKGNRYIRSHKETGRSFERDKLKRQDLDAWHLYKMVDSCRQLTVSQSNDDDTAGMVTLLTGHPLDDLCGRSAAMKSAMQAVSSAGMELKNVADFYRQWKEMG
ncbi:nonsense-mediated mRNA decay factor SMG5 [Corythoichthys intestinalis]|uniref:nonsense-mediated mRNA decay factor SMG5 n=1 Tax=Corythoichthys intestinalis TaxID=161448 RepID=UPI0025A633BA|nr:nonsense-mediated mRNA decay factor SMG5 [Corythoichthys intestinalis]XP_061789812.1 nonsense-mediated mRNA decay factor SMG5-like isoform X2 [Nerophis lumbriciformis]